MAPKTIADMFKNMLLASAVRGIDGTGMFQVSGGMNVLYTKTQMPSGVAVTAGDFDSLLSKVHDCPLTIGHVRAATAGNISDENAHPFIAFRDDDSYIIGVHNGSLWGWESGNNDHEVDSAWALDLIANAGPEAAFDEIFGAYCFMWWDSRHKNKMWFIRNDERPMHLARTKDKGSIIFASEAGMLQWLADKHNVSIEEVFSVDPNFLMSIDFTDMELTVEVEKHIPDAYEYSYRHKSWGGQYSNTTSVSTSTNQSTKKEEEDYYADGRESFLSRVKECLRKARNEVADDDRPPFEMGNVDKMESGWGDADHSWFSDDAASADEVKKAMYEGVYSRIVMFEPVQYDHLAQEMVGEIVYPKTLSRKVATLRNVTPEEADAMSSCLLTSVVVGAAWMGSETEFIIEKMNDNGYREIAA